MKYKTFLVGGAVRDRILGVKAKDFDFVVLAPSFEEMEKQLVEQGAKIFVSTPKYLTSRCHHPVFGAADFACARRDGIYTDGRRPEDTQIAESLEEDLARRDFTIGAIAMDMETSAMFDPHNGIADISNRLIRCVGDANARMAEDKFRVFRAVRFAVTKRFAIHMDTAEAIDEVTDFSGVATERIVVELEKMFAADMEESLRLLQYRFPTLWRVVRERNIGFKPTMPKP